MTTSPYTEHLRHHFETPASRTRMGRRHTDRLLAPWRRHRVCYPRTAPPQSR